MKLNRRHFLRAAGVSLALPWLEALAPAQAQGAVPRRMVCICTPLGLHPQAFFPEQAGRDYALTPYLEPFRAMRNDFTLSVPTNMEGWPGAICSSKLSESVPI